jgi:hypothetical protein
MLNTYNHNYPPRCRALMLVGVTLLAATVFGNLSSIAQASCGDYVQIGNPAHPAMGQTQHHAVPEENTAPPMEPSFPLPCHGSGCQQGDAIPPAPVPTVITSSPEIVAIVPAAGTARSTSCETRVDLRASRRIEGVLDRVERPPRFAVCVFLVRGNALPGCLRDVVINALPAVKICE